MSLSTHRLDWVKRTHRSVGLEISLEKFIYFLQNCLVDLTEYPLTLGYIACSIALLHKLFSVRKSHAFLLVASYGLLLCE